VGDDTLGDVTEHRDLLEPVDPAISYIEDISGGKYIEDAEGNRRTRPAFDPISDAALPPEDLAALIAGSKASPPSNA
jgi:hypothetical protein